MTKNADVFFLCDTWKIIETGWHKDKNLVSESIFSLGNEYMGVRGYAEEGLDAETLHGSYFNGIYEEVNLEKTYKGIITKTHFMINTVDWLFTEISVGSEVLDMANCDISNFQRVLDMKEGTLTRSFDWRINSGQIIHLEFCRFLSMEKPGYAFQKINCSVSKGSVKIDILISNSFNTIFGSGRRNFWNLVKKEWFADGAAVHAQVSGSKQQVFSGFSFSTSGKAHKSKYEGEKSAGFIVSLPLKAGEQSYIEKSIFNYAVKECDLETQAVWEYGKTRLLQGLPDFTTALAEQQKYWAVFWDKADICIEGDPSNQQGIRFCIFQMHQTYHGYDPSNNIGAKGLTGEAYGGHAFWDTEAYCLPFYLFSNPAAARNLLDYRYAKLDAAKARAVQLDCRGACYPIATLNGDECCGLWQHASLQFQPGTAVAYGIAHYANLSGDTDFLYSRGVEMLVEISRFLESRGSWNNDKSGFGFYMVMGPDEFHMMVNHNCYTNLLAKKTFEYTEKILFEMEEKVPEQYAALLEKTGFTIEERRKFIMCAEKMIILYDPDTKLYEQHEGYYKLPHIEISQIPVTDFPLYHNWSYDRIYRSDMIKQPDVLMFMFLYNSEFSREVKLKNYDFYEPRTIHESSLSPSIHSILACELGKYSDAFKFFAFATRMDLDNYNRNTGEGLHTTSIAAAWMNIVYGFGGLRSDGEILSLNPYLPEQWKSYEFRFFYRNVRIRVNVSSTEITLTTLDNVPVPIPLDIYGKRHDFTSSGLTLALAHTASNEEN